MGFMDKVKSQATELATKANEAKATGQAKIGEMQARRRAEKQLTEIGAIVYAQATGKGTDNDEARVGALVEQVKQFEAEFGALSIDTSDN
jgi:hypothetical protein